MRSRTEGSRKRGPGAARPDERGFTLVEIVIALLVLTLGALALAASTVSVVRQGLMSDLKTERVSARRAVIETIHALPYEDVTEGADTLGRFVVAWSVRTETSALKELAIVTEGPAVVADMSTTGPGAIQADVTDTLTYRIVRP